MKRALVLSGGGSKGAWQAGAISHLMGDLGRRYDVLAGTSVGALNSSFLAHFPIGEEKAASDGLLEIWNTIKPGDVYRKWYYGILGIVPFVLPRWLGGKPSMYDSRPLRRLVERIVAPEKVAASGRKLRIGAVSLTSGRRQVWTEQDGDQLVDAVLSSSSYPAAFLPIEIGDEVWSDDGLRQLAPVEEAIEAGAGEIDVLMCRDEVLHRGYDPKTNGLDVVSRLIDMMMEEIALWDIRAAALYPHVKVNVLRPSESLHDGLDFSRKKIDREIAQGLADAKAWKP